jgi:hypothetical protein
MRAWGVDAAEPIVTDPGDVRVDGHPGRRRGRGDVRWRRQGSPLVVGSLFAIAAIGASLLYFALEEGAFAGATAADRSAPKVGDVRMSDAASAPFLPR